MTDLADGIEIVNETVPPFYGAVRRDEKYHIKGMDRKFIAWDAEGQNLKGNDKPQQCVLFGSSEGCIFSKTGLNTIQICEYIIKTGREYPSAFHIGFAFGYDTNMIIRTLNEKAKRLLAEKGVVTIYGRELGQKFRIKYQNRRSITISELHPNYDPVTNKNAITSVTIDDIFGYFTTSFVDAVRSMLGDSEDLTKIAEGKKHRGGSGNCKECKKLNEPECPFDKIDYVLAYWKIEIQMLVKLASKFRERIYGAGYPIKRWYGPGTIASYVMKDKKVKDFMGPVPEAVSIASQHGYGGGRFELFKAGYISTPFQGWDINSAYPYAASMLPSFANAEWRYMESDEGDLSNLGIYRVSLDRRNDLRSPGPLFYRDKRDRISFPWVIPGGWYWGPEINWTRWRREIPELRIHDGWILEQDDQNYEQPFQWIKEIYELRRKWKKAGNPNQIALKLAINSMYGKFAQRVGWRPDSDRIPPFHQLEWAGWITSVVRGLLWDWAIKLGPHMIAIETDGFFTTFDVSKYIPVTEELGGWNMQEYDEGFYLQSGLAWLKHAESCDCKAICRTGDELRPRKWICKRRGLDKESFTLDETVEYLKTLKPMEKWKPYKGEETRFIGLKAALNRNAPLNMVHCLWQTKEREIGVGTNGKRGHWLFESCPACQEGLTAAQGAHELKIISMSATEEFSKRHHIPWLTQDDEPNWYDELEGALSLFES